MRLAAAARNHPRLVNDRALFRYAIYHGLYARRAPSIDQLFSATSATASFDRRFVQFAVAEVGAWTGYATFPTLDVCDGWAEIHIAGTRVRAPHDGALGSVLIKTPPVLYFASPGFLSRLHGQTSTAQSRRIYMALRPEDSRWFLSVLFQALACELPHFSMKTLSNPRAYRRADSSVIYVDANDLEPALEVVQNEMVRTGVSLRSIHPLGTCEVVPGLAWAVSPQPTGTTPISFGQWVRDFIVDAVEQGRATSDSLDELAGSRGRKLARLYAVQ